MDTGYVFKRYEIKYLIDENQKAEIMKEVLKRMTPDIHGESTVRNIYFDTPTYLLIRNSIEKPTYKEKFRIRCYKTADDDTTVFAEIKKKYKSVVYKRRINMSWENARCFIDSGELPVDSQIAREIKYFFELYKPLTPKLFLSYHRSAYYDGEFKVTFDTDICYRKEDLSFEHPPSGRELLPKGYTLMEVKTPEAIPLWMTKLLNDNKIYKISFSKYGEAYKRILRGE